MTCCLPASHIRWSRVAFGACCLALIYTPTAVAQSDAEPKPALAQPEPASAVEAKPEPTDHTEGEAKRSSSTKSRGARSGDAAGERDEPKAPYPRFHPVARLQTGVELRKVFSAGAEEVADSRQPFFLDQARLGIEVEINAALDAAFDAELIAEPAIRDAYVNLKVRRFLQLRAGHFKRPISRTELQGIATLPFRRRGLGSEFLRDEAWAGRSLGVMAWGKLRKPKLRWSVAVMNAGPTIDVSELDRTRGVDLLGRVEYSPVPWLELAVDGGYKISEPYADGPNQQLSALGGDVLLQAAGLRLVLEARAAQNPHPPVPPSQTGRTPFGLVFLGYATYDIPIARETALQPILLVERLDTDRDRGEDETLRVVFGVNVLLWESVLRLLPQVEIVRRLGDSGARSRAEQTTYYLLLSMQL